MNLLKTVEETGVKAWLVGGTVRMIEMGIQPVALTLALDTQDLKKVAKATGGTVDTRGPFPVLRGTYGEMGIPFKALPIRGGSIEDDLARRDFSIESIALRSDGGVVDPFGGRLDIRNRVLRLNGDNIDLIKDDPMRVGRMLRFAADLEMDIFWKTDSDVRHFLEKHPESMEGLAPERWGREVIRGMRRHPWRFIMLCDSYRLLPFFLPDLEALKDVKDEKGQSLFDHVTAILQVIESRLDTHKLAQSEAFILAGLLSLIGARSLEQWDCQRTERLVSDYLTHWNIPSEIISAVTAIIVRYPEFYEPHDEAQFCATVLEYSPTAVEIALEFAECVALAEKFDDSYREVLRENRWNLQQVLRRFEAVELQTEGSTRFLTGREVMSLLNMAPGRRVGELLDGLDMAVGTGKVNTLAKAEEWLRAQPVKQ
ncbi:MAG: hypothetical protein K5841_04110 [Fretibacterium sp.]|nr:hypothetical protein [Fretibacterium sp.]